MEAMNNLMENEATHLIGKNSEDEKAIGIFYAPAGGNVHKIARRIRQSIHHKRSEMFHITEIKPTRILDFKHIILVASTVGSIHWEDDIHNEWASFMPGINHIALNGRQVAIVGLGDHIGYPDNFCDGIADLSEWVRQAGGIIVGRTSTDGYTYTSSRAVRDRLFDGLPIDEENESDLTNARIEKWLGFVMTEFDVKV